MNISIAEREAMIAAQAGQVPSIYGRVAVPAASQRIPGPAPSRRPVQLRSAPA